MPVHRKRPLVRFTIAPATDRMIDDLKRFDKNRSRVVDAAVSEYWNRRRKG